MESAKRAARVTVPSRGRSDAPALAIALLGTGAVGGALLGQLATRRPPGLRLVAVADSRRQIVAPEGLDADHAAAALRRERASRSNSEIITALDATTARQRVIVDATASPEVARRHPLWLAAGCHVVTANKALNGGSQADWQAILAACAAAGVHYGASATVGAGLPVIDTLRRWRLAGDRLASIEGVFSGSLSWLFNRFDGARPFSALLREAREAGYSEPDPRADLSGLDVARKLLILARNAGIELHPEQVRVDNLVPAALRDLPRPGFDARLAELDGMMAARLAAARRDGHLLRHLATLDGRGARVGLVAVPESHPAAQLAGRENLFVLASDSYADCPLVIRGPGAGPGVTAQALLADVMQLLGGYDLAG